MTTYITIYQCLSIYHWTKTPSTLIPFVPFNPFWNHILLALIMRNEYGIKHFDTIWYHLRVCHYFHNHVVILLIVTYLPCIINTLRSRQMDAISKTTFSNALSWMKMFQFGLKFVPKGPINNIPAMVQIMAWRRPGDKPLYEPMVLSLPTHICVVRPQ